MWPEASERCRASMLIAFDADAQHRHSCSSQAAKIAIEYVIAQCEMLRSSYEIPTLAPPMIPNPHDALVKAVFGKPEHAQGMLRAAIPAALAETLHWSTLTLCPGSFVDAALKEQHTDLLYSMTLHDGGEALVDFLFEHLSAPPRKGTLTAFRLLRYQVRIWENRVERRELEALFEREIGPEARKPS